MSVRATTGLPDKGRDNRGEAEILPQSTRSRKENHHRRLDVWSFECEDGTTELELRLVDTKAFPFSDRERGILQPGDAVHSINARITIDADMNVVDVLVDLESMPFIYCLSSSANIEILKGKSLRKGWRKSVTEALGSTRGCTHLSELLFLAPTVAFQTAAIRQSDAGRAIGRNDTDAEEAPFFLGGCHSWAVDSPVTRRHFPRFADPGIAASEEERADESGL